MKYEYKTQGVCSMKIDFELDGNKVHNVSFLGGCDGNLKAIGKLVEGKDASEVVNILSGNTCGFKNTSCADQLAKAIADAMTRQ